METQPPPVFAVVDVELDKPIKKPQQIEAVLTSAVPWAELAPLVFVGTSDATLHCYVPSGGAATALAFLHWHSSFKKIFHACARFVDSWGVYVTLVDNKLAMYSLPLHANPHLDGSGNGNAAREAMVSIDDTKNTVQFAVNEDARVVCCLTKQNTLRVYDWTVNRTLELRVHQLLPSSVLPVQKMLLLGESHVLLLFKKEWSVVNVDNGKVVELTTATASTLVSMDTIACATLLPPSPLAPRSTLHGSTTGTMRDAFVAGKHFAVRISLVSSQSDASTSYSSSDGLKVAAERVLEYNVPPKNVFHHHPFVLLDHQDKLVVYSVASMKAVVATLPIKAMYGGCTTVALPSSWSSSASSLSRDLLGRGLPVSFLTIAAPFTAQLLRMTPVPTLLEQHVVAGRLEDAVMLAELCPEEVALNDDEENTLFADYANDLFREKRQFPKAMEYFARARADIEHVLALYPRDLLPRVSVMQARPDATSKLSPQPPLALQGDELVKSLVALIEFLTKARDPLIQAINPDGWGQPPALQLHQQRLQLLDTVLLKCLVLISEQPANPQQKKMSYQLFELVRSANWCEVGETEVFLRAHNQYDTLLSFYASRRLHRKALELLEDLERSAAAAENVATATDTNSKEYAKPSTNGLRSSADYLERTTLYLKRLGQKRAELVFEFSKRVIYADAAMGLSIFTHRDEDIEDGDHDIDPALILAHLKSCPVPHPATETSAAASSEEEKEADDSTTTPIALPLSNSRFLAIEYITQVILHDRVSVAPRLHDDAVYLLLDAIHAELENGGTASSSTALSPLARLAPRVSSQRGLLGLLRRKLMAFLECARAQFHPERMLSRTPHEMVDERAALLSRLGRHHEVLQLYALQLRDAALAEAYCNKCYESKYADSSIYSTLLRLYLRPMRATSSTSIVGSSSSPPKPLWQRSTSLQVPATGVGGGTMATSPSEAVTAAINVLNKYAERIDVAAALDLLPSDVPVAALATFFRRVLEHQVERYRNGQIKMQLAKMENFKVRDKLTSKRKESVTVWSSHCCHVCGKKLGVGTFVRLPQVGGTVTLVHFSCQPVGETRPAVGTLGTW